jgi:hypothetical protein
MKFQKLATVAVIGLLGFASLAATPEDDNPAASQKNCDAIEGAWSDAGENKTRVRECVVTLSGGDDTVAASHKQQAWTVDVTTPGSVTTYRLAAGEGATTTSTGGGAPTVTACYNHQGKSISDFETNPNCRPSS